MCAHTTHGPSRDDLAACLEAMARLWRASMRRQHPRVPDEHLDLLHLVDTEDPVTVTELARTLHISTTAVRRAAARLHAAGLLSCDTAAEPQQLHCRLTSDGRSFLNRLRATQCHHIALALKRLTPRAQHAAAEFVTELATTLDRRSTSSSEIDATPQEQRRT